MGLLLHERLYWPSSEYSINNMYISTKIQGKPRLLNGPSFENSVYDISYDRTRLG